MFEVPVYRFLWGSGKGWPSPSHAQSCDAAPASPALHSQDHLDWRGAVCSTRSAAVSSMPTGTLAVSCQDPSSMISSCRPISDPSSFGLLSSISMPGMLDSEHGAGGFGVAEMVECQSHGMIGHVVSLLAPAPNQRREIPVENSARRKWFRATAPAASGAFTGCGQWSPATFTAIADLPTTMLVWLVVIAYFWIYKCRTILLSVWCIIGLVSQANAAAPSSHC